MASKIWIAPGGRVPLLFTGTLEFQDKVNPSPGLNEWGVDTLRRVVHGPAYLLDSFLASLRKGSVFRDFYLQSWEPSPAPLAPTVTLLYKGLTAGVPDPLPTNSRCELTATISATGLHKTIASVINPNTGTAGVIIAATKELRYIAPQTVWRYVSKTEPQGPKFSDVRGIKATGEAALQILDSRITVTFDDGHTQQLIGYGAPDAIATALAVTPSPLTIGPESSPIVGSPFWEASETVQLRYPG